MLLALVKGQGFGSYGFQHPFAGGLDASLGLRDPRQNTGPVVFPPAPPDNGETSGVIPGASGYGFVPPNQSLQRLWKFKDVLMLEVAKLRFGYGQIDAKPNLSFVNNVLPKLKFPHIFGSFLEYTALIGGFHTTVDNVDISDANKLRYLKSCLKGEVAASLEVLRERNILTRTNSKNMFVTNVFCVYKLWKKKLPNYTPLEFLKDGVQLLTELREDSNDQIRTKTFPHKFFPRKFHDKSYKYTIMEIGSSTESLPDLEIEVTEAEEQEQQSKINDRRIVDIAHFFSALKSLKHDGFGCSFFDMDIVSERRKGFVSLFINKRKEIGSSTESLPDLEIEVTEAEEQEQQSKINDRRIVDIAHFFSALKSLKHDGFGCSFFDMDIVSERRKGFVSLFINKRKVCHKSEIISTENSSIPKIRG
ncbi:hypothetical protein FQA39_LY01657 [Lamprigera yunnana]|nr:hypothetical protein FQA39_LY01657 [Lamprigera yunnana]